MNSFARPRSSIAWLALWRAATLAFAALVALLLFAESAEAQSCRQVQDSIRSIERNRDYRNYTRNAQTFATLQNDLARLQRSFVDAGCQQALNAGQNLSRECRTAASQIRRGQNNLQALQNMVASGQQLAQQHDALAAKLQSGDCTSSATVTNRNIFQQIFDSLSGNGLGSETIQEDQTYIGRTVRSVCVRISDGYYWPISFSTVPEYLSDDLGRCQAMCPNEAVDLYYYHNPGEGPGDMINLSGSPYSALPAAFSYRQNYDLSLRCNLTSIDSGRIEISTVDGESRPILTMGDLTIPLPLRDPRHLADVPVIIEASYTPPIPLPRPRPDLEAGETQARTAVVQNAELRIIDVGGKTVRLVGPVTPYAQLGEGAT